MKTILFIVSVCVFFFSVQGQANTYTLVRPAWSGLEPVIVADRKGFFKKEGIDIEIKRFTTLTDWFRAISSGRFDFNVIYAENAIDFYINNVSRNVVPGIYCSDIGEITAIVGKKGITAEQIKGSAVGFNADALTYKYILYEYLSTIGLTLDDVKIVHMPGDDLIPNLTIGRLSLITAFGYNIQTLKSEHDCVVLSTTAQHRVALMTYMIPVERFKKMPKEDLKKFWRGLISAVLWMKDPKNEKELRDIITNEFIHNPEVTQFYSSGRKLKEYRKLFKFYDLNEYRYYNSERLTSLFSEVTKINKRSGITHDLNYSEVVNTSALQEVLEEMGAW